MLESAAESKEARHENLTTSITIVQALEMPILMSVVPRVGHGLQAPQIRYKPQIYYCAILLVEASKNRSHD